MKVGLLGGTFDPVHNGHLALASAAYAELGLDVVLFVAAGQPWRKGDREITPSSHRLAMLQLAIAGDPRFGVSDVELRRSGPTYTADTVESLAGERLDDELYFIIGSDALEDLPNWHEPDRITRHAVLAVAPRAGELADVGRSAVEAGIDATRVQAFQMVPSDVSSSDIRSRIAEGLPVDELTPPAVAAYVRDARLYRRPR